MLKLTDRRFFMTKHVLQFAFQHQVKGFFFAFVQNSFRETCRKSKKNSICFLTFLVCFFAPKSREFFSETFFSSSCELLKDLFLFVREKRNDLDLLENISVLMN
jgi:hypothetical protein